MLHGTRPKLDCGRTSMSGAPQEENMLYVIAFFAAPIALFSVHRPLQAVIVLACYILAWIGLIAAFTGMILYFFPIFILWFALFWFVPTRYTIAVIKAQAAGRAAPESVDYAFASNRLGFTLLSIIVFLGTSATIFWLYAAHRLRERLDTWVKTQDYALRWDNASLEGFPLTVGLRLTGATFGGTKLLPYKFSAPLVTIGPEALWDQTLINVAAQNVTGSETLAGLCMGEVFVQVHLAGGPSSNPQGNFPSLTANVRELRLPEAPRPLSDTIDRVVIYAYFNGIMLPGLSRESLATWRDRGGSIDALGIELKWGALELIIYDGILKLDQTLQPTGSFTAIFINQNPVIDAAVAAGGLSARDGDAVKSALASSAKRTSHGSTRSVQDMRIENGHLKIGPTEIVALPRLMWP
jgi:hypothetical protein